MKKLQLTLFIILFSLFNAKAQGVWTWMHGDTSFTQTIYGTKNVYNINNTPFGNPKNYITDNNGIFWMLDHQIDTLTSCELTELWSFNPTINQWAWHGSNTNNCGKGVYSAMGVPNIANEIPNSNPPYMWIDLNNNLWLYMQIGDSLNPTQPANRREMWMYNTTSNMWTWVRNDTMMCDIFSNNMCNNSFVPNVYSPILLPYLQSGQSNFTEKLAWTLQSGELMLGVSGQWYYKYNTALNQWAWVTGHFYSPTTYNQQPMGQRFVEATSNTFRDFNFRYGAPGIDDQDRIYHYQLYGALSASTDDFFCLRRFNHNNNRWTWVSGDTTDWDNSHFGTQCNGDVNNYSNYPSFDGFQSTQSKTCKNNLWLYNTSTGGNGIYSINLTNYKFTWHRGDTIFNGGLYPPYYGIKGIPNPLNNPSYFGAQAMWADNLNNVWIFNGGMWRFTPDFNCMGFFVDTTNKITPPTDTLLCLGDTIKYTIDTSYKLVQFIPNNNTASYDTATHQISMYPSVTTNYTVIGVRYSAAGCSRNDTTNFKLTIYPQTPFTYNPPVILPLCAGNSSVYNVPTGIKIKNISPSSSLIFNADTSSITFKPATTTTYTIIAFSTNANGCKTYDTATLLVTVLPLNTPVLISPNPDTLFCTNDITTMNIDTSYTFTLTPNTGVTYNADSSLIAFKPSVNTIYTLTATSQAPCPATKTIIFPISLSNQITKAIFGFDPNPVNIKQGSTAETIIRNYSQNANQYTWIYNNQIISSQENGGVLTFTDTGKFCVTLIACKGTCCDTVTNCGEVINPTEYIALPNAFSPNGDGLNDELKILYRLVTVKEFAIYNRWGQKVFATTDINKGWDGKLNGKDQAMDSFYYYIKYQTSKGENKLLKGNVILVR